MTQRHSQKRQNRFKISVTLTLAKTFSFSTAHWSSLFREAMEHEEKESSRHVVAVKACWPAIYFCTDSICEPSPSIHKTLQSPGNSGRESCSTLEGCLVKHCLFLGLESIVWGVRGIVHTTGTIPRSTEVKKLQCWGFIHKDWELQFKHICQWWVLNVCLMI